MLTVHPQTILEEMKSTQKILAKWIELIENKQMPAVDLPAGEEALDDFVREMCGELRVCAGKCGNLADVLLAD